MLHKNDFALEQLESRLETFCIYVPYLGSCRVCVGWFCFYVPCWKYRRICF